MPLAEGAYARGWRDAMRRVEHRADALNECSEVDYVLGRIRAVTNMPCPSGDPVDALTLFYDMVIDQRKLDPDEVVALRSAIEGDEIGTAEARQLLAVIDDCEDVSEAEAQQLLTDVLEGLGVIQ